MIASYAGRRRRKEEEEEKEERTVITILIDRYQVLTGTYTYLLILSTYLHPATPLTTYTLLHPFLLTPCCTPYYLHPAAPLPTYTLPHPPPTYTLPHPLLLTPCPVRIFPKSPSLSHTLCPRQRRPMTLPRNWLATLATLSLPLASMYSSIPAFLSRSHCLPPTHQSQRWPGAEAWRESRA